MGPLRAGDNIMDSLLMRDKIRHLFCFGEMWTIRSHPGNLGWDCFLPSRVQILCSVWNCILVTTLN